MRPTNNRELGDSHGEAGSCNNLGIALREVRRFDDATRAWGEAVAAYDDAGDEEAAARVRRWLEDFDTGSA